MITIVVLFTRHLRKAERTWFRVGGSSADIVLMLHCLRKSKNMRIKSEGTFVTKDQNGWISYCSIFFFSSFTAPSFFFFSLSLSPSLSGLVISFAISCAVGGEETFNRAQLPIAARDHIERIARSAIEAYRPSAFDQEVQETYQRWMSWKDGRKSTFSDLLRLSSFPLNLFSPWPIAANAPPFSVLTLSSVGFFFITGS